MGVFPMRHLARAALVLLSLSLLTSAWAADQPATKPAGRSLEMKLADGKTHQPLAGVALKMQVSCDDGKGKDAKTSDENGVATLTIPGTEVNYIYISAKKEGYVPMRVMWRRDGGQPDPVPASYTLEMEPGTKISGQVVDDAGKPIGSATVV